MRSRVSSSKLRTLPALLVVGTLWTALALASTWETELPATSAVLRTTQGTSPEDTAARQAAAFSVLDDAIEVLSGHSEFDIAHMPPAAQRAMREYQAARGQAIARGHLSNLPIDHYFFSKPFREEIVSRYLSPASQAAYWRVRSTAMFGNGTTGTTTGVAPLGQLAGAADRASSAASDVTSTIRSYAAMGIALLVALALLTRSVWFAIRTYNVLGPMRQKIRMQESNCKTVLDKKATLINEQYALAQRVGEMEQMVMLKVSSDASASGLRALAMQSGALMQSIQSAAERFPNLRSNAQFQELGRAIGACEDEIQRYRETANKLIESYNSTAGQFPRVLFARLFGFKEEPFLDLDVSKARFQAHAPVLTQTENASRLDHVLGMAPGHAPAPAALPPYANPHRLATPAPATPALASHAPAPYASHPLQLAPAAPASLAPAVSARGGATTAFAMPQIALRFLSGPLGGRTVPVEASGVIIGREPQAAQLVVPDGAVSSAHAWIGLRGQGFVFMDRGSTNGSLVNGESIQPNREVNLKQGDVVTLGRQNTVSFVVEQA